ncbi:uncharacterized protein MONBRDRAFT_31533 [Monosiga brevicollis MX1]|uniref:DUF7897 domain-containing protein n=1 Tax=Monosiga brevicollis TaxID=81824 RepID=A9UTT2_MONBE|nr:uncharacterized protein MONBRDRAFT_31533 [Monosiga brevicollis MX1]EDQ91547.1 predicted protein [Monosiga brevicollis MX1]|eukprot:XP_001743969.1 hypothetical protein [Monosiga brevicollis MX1]
MVFEAALANFAAIKGELAGHAGISLLKKIEEASHQLIRKHIEKTYPSANQDKYIRAAIASQFVGVRDFSDEFYDLLDLASASNDVARAHICSALDELPHGFPEFDAVLLKYSAVISHYYDAYYRAWSKKVQGNETAKKLEADGSPGDAALLNPYTIITWDAATSSYTHAAYATVFKTELVPVLQAFDDLVAQLEVMQDLTAEQKNYLPFLRQYRVCLALEDIEQLDSAWEELDRRWMDCKYHIQLVHDIESGYGDPLRVKVIPDFSIRFLDMDYKDANDTIAAIQADIVEYFRQRKTDLSQKGLFALSASLAGIYYLPFQSGMSLHFRFSGQSIPNRSAVKNEKGVKIYFDAVSTGARLQTTGDMVEKVCVNGKELAALLDAVDTIVYHVAAHEVGHAIYNLDHVKGSIKPDTCTLLEEPRAELTSLTTMKLLVERGRVAGEDMAKHLASFALQDLRRFANFDSSATRPYTISAISTYKLYLETGFVTRVGDQLEFHLDKYMNVLDACQQRFEAILDAEDAHDGAALEKILEEMQQESELVHHLVQMLKPTAAN